jgi:hypothetical protein
MMGSISSPGLISHSSCSSGLEMQSSIRELSACPRSFGPLSPSRIRTITCLFSSDYRSVLFAWHDMSHSSPIAIASSEVTPGLFNMI